MSEEIDLAADIRETRKRLKLSQKAFGAIVGVGKQAVCNWEAGLRAPSADKIAKIREYIKNQNNKPKGVK